MLRGTYFIICCRKIYTKVEKSWLVKHENIKKRMRKTELRESITMPNTALNHGYIQIVGHLNEHTENRWSIFTKETLRLYTHIISNLKLLINSCTQRCCCCSLVMWFDRRPLRPKEVWFYLLQRHTGQMVVKLGASDPGQFGIKRIHIYGRVLFVSKKLTSTHVVNWIIPSRSIEVLARI